MRQGKHIDSVESGCVGYLGMTRTCKKWSKAEIEMLLNWRAKKYDWDKIAMFLSNKYHTSRTAEACKHRFKMERKKQRVVLSYNTAPAIAITRCMESEKL